MFLLLFLTALSDTTIAKRVQVFVYRSIISLIRIFLVFFCFDAEVSWHSRLIFCGGRADERWRIQLTKASSLCEG